MSTGVPTTKISYLVCSAGGHCAADAKLPASCGEADDRGIPVRVHRQHLSCRRATQLPRPVDDVAARTDSCKAVQPARGAPESVERPTNGCHRDVAGRQTATKLVCDAL
jgi:hypothetical protein